MTPGYKKPTTDVEIIASAKNEYSEAKATERANMPKKTYLSPPKSMTISMGDNRTETNHDLYERISPSELLISESSKQNH